MSAGCLFCRIAAGEVPSDVVYQDDHVLAFRDINPRAPTHVLVVPRRHIPSARDLGPGDGELLGAMFGAANRVTNGNGVAHSGFRLVINVGPAAGQSVDHLHLHVLGGRQFRWPPG